MANNLFLDIVTTVMNIIFQITQSFCQLWFVILINIKTSKLTFICQSAKLSPIFADIFIIFLLCFGFFMVIYLVLNFRILLFGFMTNLKLKSWICICK